MRLDKRLGFTVALLAPAAGLWFGTRRERNALGAAVQRLRETARCTPAEPGVGESIEAVPAPVRRYLQWAIRSDTQILEVRIAQVGTLRTDVKSERWMSFEAEHTVVPPATGFVWNARVRVAPGVHVRVRDALVNGQGSGHVSLMSAIPVSAASNTPEMNSGSLHRYLAEAVWYPTALLPSEQLKWTAIDRNRALATLTAHNVSVSLEFRFAPSGEVSGIYTPARWGTFAEGYRQVPWEGHFRGYLERDGVMVPTAGDVGWYVDGEWRPVWKGTITAFQLVANT